MAAKDQGAEERDQRHELTSIASSRLPYEGYPVG